MKPFSASRSRHGIPKFFPRTRNTLVAPMLPEPCWRMSIPRDLAMSRPKGMEPRRNARIGQSQSCINKGDEFRAKEADRKPKTRPGSFDDGGGRDHHVFLGNIRGCHFKFL